MSACKYKMLGRYESLPPIIRFLSTRHVAGNGGNRILDNLIVVSQRIQKGDQIVDLLFTQPQVADRVTDIALNIHNETAAVVNK